MESTSDKYVMLITGLPYHGPLFGAKQTPLSRIRLDRRLRVLTDDDAADLAMIESVLNWGLISDKGSDAELVGQSKKVLATLENPLLLRIVQQRLELRTLVAALRRRNRGESSPPTDKAWGIGRHLSAIQRNWREPGFGLERAHPWLREADNLLKQENSLGLERLILGEAWSQLERLSEEHLFDFEAVVIYVLRWNIVDRWTGYNADEAAARFGELVDAAIDESDLAAVRGEA